MPHHRVLRQISGGMPFNVHGLMDDDLEAHFPDFGRGRPLWWGTAVGAVSGSFHKETLIRGLDWDVTFYPPKCLRLPHPSKNRIRATWRSVSRDCCVVRVRTDKTDMNEARTVGAPAARSLLALLRREVPLLLPGDTLWEGALCAMPHGRERMSTAPRLVEAARPASPRRLESAGLKLARVSVLGLPPHVDLALEWMSLARSASVKAEQFVHLWLCVLTLASYKQGRGRGDMERIRRYAKTMMVGQGGVQSELSIAELIERFRQAYKVRNRLLHHADDSGIKESLLTSLEDDAFELVDFELAKLGTPISA